MIRSFVVYVKMLVCDMSEIGALVFFFSFFSIVYYLGKITFVYVKWKEKVED